MPNWVLSELIIRGSPEKLKEFVEYNKYTDEDGDIRLLSADKYIPIPEDMLYGKCNDCGFKSKDIKECGQECPNCGSKNTKDWYNNGGYEWCVDHWGSKWNFVDVKMEEDDGESGEIIYNFNTAWSPMLPVIKAMSIKFMDLTFIYKVEEEAHSFMGYYVATKGCIQEHITDFYTL